MKKDNLTELEKLLKIVKQGKTEIENLTSRQEQISPVLQRQLDQKDEEIARIEDRIDRLKGDENGGTK